jgi:hypothetical protein
VNTASKVYHCPATRYYGTTARGAYMLEGEATRQGHRPSGGRTCGAVLPLKPLAAGDTVRSTVASAVKGNPNARVWVNTSSRVYHCPGTRYYGSTKNGTYMRQQDAQAAGHRPAAGGYCS